MPKELEYYYWDACVPLSYINGITDRLPHIDAFMSKSGEDFQIVTSVLSITEVAFATCEKDQKTLDPDIEAKISRLWQAGSPIKIVEFYELIAVREQGLMRAAITNGWSLRPADAIHIATADQLKKVKVFHTYDERLAKFSVLTDTKFPIVPPISAEPYLLLMDASAEAVPSENQVGSEAEEEPKREEITTPAKEAITGGQRQTDSDAAAERNTIASPPPTPDSTTIEPEQSASGGQEQKLGEQASPPSSAETSVPQSEPPASEEPKGGGDVH